MFEIEDEKINEEDKNNLANSFYGIVFASLICIKKDESVTLSDTLVLFNDELIYLTTFINRVLPS